MHVDWTTIFASGFTAAIIGVFQLVGARYTKRILDKIEKKLGITNDEDKK